MASVGYRTRVILIGKRQSISPNRPLDSLIALHRCRSNRRDPQSRSARRQRFRCISHGIPPFFGKALRIESPTCGPAEAPEAWCSRALGMDASCGSERRDHGPFLAFRMSVASLVLRCSGYLNNLRTHGHEPSALRLGRSRHEPCEPDIPWPIVSGILYSPPRLASPRSGL